ncbi:MAG: hypothetical protein AAFY59_19785, partial [Pseudomonadota bacterium]
MTGERAASAGTFLRDGLLAAIATALLAAFTYFLLNPQFGFDDANITQNYAENIAAGVVDVAEPVGDVLR